MTVADAVLFAGGGVQPYATGPACVAIAIALRAGLAGEALPGL